LAKKEAQRRRVIRYTKSITALRGLVKSFAARKRLLQYMPAVEPVQCVFTLTTDEAAKGLLPWTWRMFMTPTDEFGEEQKFRSIYPDLFAKSERQTCETSLQLAYSALPAAWWPE
jgi:hypothetical protein